MPDLARPATATSKERVQETYAQVEKVMAGDEAVKVTNDKKLGKVVGDVQLSEKAEKYYTGLTSKYKNMEFVLVSKDMKETAKAHAGAFASAGKMVVLIDEEKIEKMAEDPNYRKKYEGIIANSQNELLEIKNKVGDNDLLANFGMKVNDDGSTSFFAVFNKNQKELADQVKTQQEKKAAQKKADEKVQAKKDAKKAEEKKLADKKTEEKEAAEKAEEKRLGKKQEEDAEDYELAYMSDEYEVVYADSADALLKKIWDYTARAKSNNVYEMYASAPGERHNIDFSA
jgi:hypothetical protein